MYDGHRKVGIVEVRQYLANARLQRPLDRYDREFVPKAPLKVVHGRVVAFESHGQA